MTAPEQDRPDLPDQDHHDPDRPGNRRFQISQELRGWIAGLSALALAMMAVGVPGDTGELIGAIGVPGGAGSKLMPNPSPAVGKEPAGGVEVPGVLSCGDPATTVRVETNIPTRLQQSLCAIAENPLSLLDPTLVAIETDSANVIYSTPFTVGFVLGPTPSALLPIVVDEAAIQVTITGSGDFLEPCARVQARVQVETTGLGADVNSESVVLFPDYYLKPPAMAGSGSLQSRMSIEISGVGPSGADLANWPIVACTVNVLVPYAQGIVPNVLATTTDLFAHPPSDIVLQLGSCQGTEGAVECLGIVSDLATGTSITVAGPWDALRIAPTMHYTWTDGSRVDEDKAYVSLSPGSRMRAEVGAHPFTTSATLHEADQTIRYCSSMEVRDVDQFWDANGNQHLDEDHFCLSVTYVRVAQLGELALPKCGTALFHAPSEAWNGGGALQCLPELVYGDPGSLASLGDSRFFVLEGGAQPLAIIAGKDVNYIVPSLT